MARQQSVNVTILLDEAYKENPSQVVVDLKSKGFVLKEALSAVGVLTGRVPAIALAKLTEVPGVSAVEEDRNDYRIQNSSE